MIFDYSKADMKSLEFFSREFLWAFLVEGRAKTALIAWKNLSMPKLHRGLDIYSFRNQAKVLKQRHLTKILEGVKTEWIRIAAKKVVTHAGN
jgi:hypothetical protein